MKRILPLFFLMFALQAAEPLVSGYAGWWLDVPASNYDLENLYLKPMQSAGFNAIDMKIFSKVYGEAQISELEKLAPVIEKYGLEFHVYATPLTHGTDKNTPQFPPVVNENGEFTKRICLGKYETFKRVYEGAFVIAKLSDKLGVKSVKLDLEWIGSLLPCYCDSCWTGFAAANGVPESTPRDGRYSLLREKNLNARYNEAMNTAWAETAKSYEREMHDIAPKLMLGMMPADDTPLYLPFVKYLATPNVPAIMDSWCMYGGNGYNDLTRKTLAWIRTQNPHNIAQPWLWVIYYYPESITEQCYGLLRDGIGYTLYPLSAMRLESGNLFPGKAAPEVYFDAFGKANAANSERLTKGADYRETIQFKPVKALVPQCNRELVKNLPLTAFMPEANPGRISPVTMRHQNVFYVLADEKNPLSFTCWHQAADRVTAIAIDIIDSATGEVLLSEALPSGTNRKFEYPVDRSRILGVIFNGGDVGPWYSVMFHSKRFGVLGYRPDERTHCYFMGRIDRPVYLMPERGAKSFTFTLSGGPVEYELYSPSGAKVSEGRTALPNHSLSVTAKSEPGAWKLVLRSPAQTVHGESVQNCWLNFVSGLEPLFGFSPESMLTLKKGSEE